MMNITTLGNSFGIVPFLLLFWFFASSWYFRALISYFLKASTRIEKSSSGVHEVLVMSKAGRSCRREGDVRGSRREVSNAKLLGDRTTSVTGVVDGSLNFGKKERSVSI